MITTAKCGVCTRECVRVSYLIDLKFGKLAQQQTETHRQCVCVCVCVYYQATRMDSGEYKSNATTIHRANSGLWTWLHASHGVFVFFFFFISGWCWLLRIATHMNVLRIETNYKLIIFYLYPPRVAGCRKPIYYNIAF